MAETKHGLSEGQRYLQCFFDSFPKAIQYQIGFIYSEIHANITHIGVSLTYATVKRCTMSFESED